MSIFSPFPLLEFSPVWYLYSNLYSFLSSFCLKKHLNDHSKNFFLLDYKMRLQLLPQTFISYNGKKQKNHTFHKQD